MVSNVAIDDFRPTLYKVNGGAIDSKKIIADTFDGFGNPSKEYKVWDFDIKNLEKIDDPYKLMDGR